MAGNAGEQSATLPAPHVDASTGCALDLDADGHLDSAANQVAGDACARALPGDCDDTRGTVHADAPETCNGLDDDCDGETDEGRTCDIPFERTQGPIDSADNLVDDGAGVVYFSQPEPSRVVRLSADGGASWSIDLPGIEHERQRPALAVDPSRGALYVAALMDDPERGDHPFTTVLRLDSTTGEQVFRVVLDVAARPTAIAIDPNGDIEVSGIEQESPSSDPATGVGLWLRLSADGAVVMEQTYPDLGLQGIAVADDGAIAIAVGLDALDASGQIGPCSVAPPDRAALVYIEPDDSCGFVDDVEEVGGSVPNPHLGRVGFLADGAIVVGGAPYAAVDFAGAQIGMPRVPNTGVANLPSGEPRWSDALIAVVERTGALRWSHQIVNAGVDGLSALRVDSDTILAAVQLEHWNRYDPGYLSAVAEQLGIVLALDAQTGTERWSRDFELEPGHWIQAVTALARAGDGTLLLATVDLAATPLLRLQPPSGP